MQDAWNLFEELVYVCCTSICNGMGWMQLSVALKCIHGHCICWCKVMHISLVLESRPAVAALCKLHDLVLMGTLLRWTVWRHKSCFFTERFRQKKWHLATALWLPTNAQRFALTTLNFGGFLQSISSMNSFGAQKHTRPKMSECFVTKTHQEIHRHQNISKSRII